MYICSSKAFLQGKGAKTLVGLMAERFGDKSWMTVKDLQDGNF